MGTNGNRPLANLGLTRQPSIYSLTFDELQTTMGLGSMGKDFGSLNMDELLKNIWTAEESQICAAVTGSSAAAVHDGTNLQRQGSLTLPRTLSQKTVEEVWRDLSKECENAAKNSYPGSSNGNMPQAQTQRQQTLGEITLEEFLVRAGVVREDAQPQQTQLGAGKIGNGGFFNEFGPGVSNNTGFGIGYQQMGRHSNNLMANRVIETTNAQNSAPQSNLPLNVNGVRADLQPKQQPIFPKQPAMGYASQLPIQGGAQLGSPGIRGGIMGIRDQGITNTGLVQLGGSPASQLSPNGMSKSNGDTSSVSPVPYVFNGNMRGRKMSGPVQKVVERRQRRMIKNRESAARSRARKQAYTVELEQEVAKLKEENQQLQKKQEEIMEMQKNQALEMMSAQRGSKRRCLRRTQTGPW